MAASDVVFVRINLRSARIALRGLAETGQAMPEHKFREEIDKIIKTLDDTEGVDDDDAG